MIDYPESLKVAPLTTWPGEFTRTRVRSPFSAKLSVTLETLDRELFQLSARSPVLEVAIEPAQFRLDGRPRSTARADHPGVVLSLPNTRVGPLRYAVDRFETWQDNLRAIALGMEALRKVDRYGVTRRGEQYAGFKAIETASSADSLTLARRQLGDLAGWPVEPTTPEDIKLAYRHAAQHHHPDRGGDVETFQALEALMRIIRGER